MKTKPILAVDFETEWSDEWSITQHGPNYALYCNPYLVSLHNGKKTWAGDPRKVAWERLLKRYNFVSHNAAFDAAVYLGMVMRGEAIGTPDRWHCSADMCAYLHITRSLAGACKEVFDKVLSKEVRAASKRCVWDPDTLTEGMVEDGWREFTAEEKKEMLKYAGDDAIWCWRLWRKLSDGWPEQERALSEETIRMGLTGVPIDVDELKRQTSVMLQVTEACKKRIPWANKMRRKKTISERYEPIPLGSPTAFEEACEKAGVPVPRSKAKNDPAYKKWLETYGDKVPFANALGEFRSNTRGLRILEKLPNYVDEDHDGTPVMRYGLKYCGAATLRYSGTDGLNMQNLPRDPSNYDNKGRKITVGKPTYSVYLRSLFVARPGHQLVVCDYASVEAVVGLWYQRDLASLKRFADGMDIYEVHARSTMGYSDPGELKDVDPKLRSLAKVRVLSLQYKTGALKFMHTADNFGIKLDMKEASKHVTNFRTKRLKKAWDCYFEPLQEAAEREKKVHVIELPSGNLLYYWHPRIVREAVTWVYYDEETDSVKKENAVVEQVRAAPFLGEASVSYHQGKVFENVVSATSRDLLTHAVVNVLPDYGILPNMLVHDEIVTEEPEDFDPNLLLEAMTNKPDWARGLPVKGEVKTMSKYAKA